MSSQEIGVLLIALGVFILVLVVFAPKYLSQVPGNRWFWGIGPRASRFGFAAGGIGFVVLGLIGLGVIPEQALGVVVVGLATVVVAAALYDFAQPSEPGKPDRPAEQSQTNGPQHRRKRRRKRRR